MTCTAPVTAFLGPNAAMSKAASPRTVDGVPGTGVCGFDVVSKSKGEPFD